jgi:apolipoprotein N-acyltransferase
MIKNSLFSSIILALCAAALSGLALSTTDQKTGMLAFISPLLLGLALRVENPRLKVLSSTSYGFCSWLLSSWWLSTGINAMNQTYWWAGLLGVFALAGLSTIPYFIFGLLCQPFKLFEKSGARPFFASALLTLLVELWPAKFPGSLTNALVSATTLIQISDWGGTALIHFLIHSVGFSLSELFNKQVSIRRRLISPALSACLVGATISYGAMQLAKWDRILADISPIRIALVQPNLHIKGAQENFGNAGTLDSLLKQTKAVLSSSPPADLIVWPEIPIYFSPFNSPPDKERINTLLSGYNTPLLLNADMFSNETINGRVPFYNAEQLFRGSGEVVEEYRKMMLVPLGEYLPFENLLTGPKLERILSGLRRYVPGKVVSLFHLTPAVTLGTPVCLEALHSAHIADMVEQGATMLINPSNDAYFADSAGATLNLSFAILRAVEFRIPVVRVTNSGISLVINQRGEIIPESRMAQFTADSRIVAVRPSPQGRPGMKPLTRGILILAVFSIFCLVLGWWHSVKESGSSVN